MKNILFIRNYVRQNLYILLKRTVFQSYVFFVFHILLLLKNLPASRAHSHRALRAQLASVSAPRARESIVALRAMFFLDLALCARSCALHIHSSLFIII